MSENEPKISFIATGFSYSNEPYGRNSHLNGNFWQSCRCGQVLRKHETNCDFIENIKQCPKCQRFTLCEAITMFDRFRGLDSLFEGGSISVREAIRTAPNRPRGYEEEDWNNYCDDLRDAP